LRVVPTRQCRVDVDAAHPHDELTRQSVTGVIISMGRTSFFKVRNGGNRNHLISTQSHRALDHLEQLIQNNFEQ
jgi:hypothetical protein